MSDPQRHLEEELAAARKVNQDLAQQWKQCEEEKAELTEELTSTRQERDRWIALTHERNSEINRLVEQVKTAEAQRDSLGSDNRVLQRELMERNDTIEGLRNKAEENDRERSIMRSKLMNRDKRIRGLENLRKSHNAVLSRAMIVIEQMGDWQMENASCKQLVDSRYIINGTGTPFRGIQLSDQNPRTITPPFVTTLAAKDEAPQQAKQLPPGSWGRAKKKQFISTPNGDLNYYHQQLGKDLDPFTKDTWTVISSSCDDSKTLTGRIAELERKVKRQVEVISSLQQCATVEANQRNKLEEEVKRLQGVQKRHGSQIGRLTWIIKRLSPWTKF